MMLRAPMRVRPSSTTWEISVQSSPSTTSGPMVQKGPTVQEAGTTAPGATTALGWMLTRPSPTSDSALGGCIAVPRHHRAGERGLAGQLAVDVGLALNAAGAGAEGEHVHLDAQLIAGRHRTAKLGALDAGEDDQLLVAVGKSRSS